MNLDFLLSSLDHLLSLLVNPLELQVVVLGLVGNDFGVAVPLD